MKTNWIKRTLVAGLALLGLMAGQAVYAQANSATVTVNVTSTNTAPVAVADGNYSVEENSSANLLAVLLNDYDTDLPVQTLSIASIGATSNGGTATINGSNISYTPAIGYSGPETFDYTISDGTATSIAATVTVNVVAANTPPVAVNDSGINVPQNSVNSPIFVLANDTDADVGDVLTITALGTPSAGGAVTINGNNVLYTPLNGYSGTETFSYTISDGTASSSATVTVNVTTANAAPVAVNDSAYSVAENSSGNVLAVLVNDSDPDLLDTLSITAVGATSNGGNVINNGTDLSYTPAPGFSGTETFSYTISDGTTTASATVTVTVRAANTAPTGAADSYSVIQDSTNLLAVLANDTDADVGDTLTIASADAASLQGGTVTNNGTDITYTPAASYTGLDSFTYTVTDGTATSTAVTVSLTVLATGGNTAPTAVDDTAWHVGTGTLNNALDVLANDTDADLPAQTLTITAVGTPDQGGTVTINGTNDGLIYSPASNYTGPESFTYTISDGTATSQATVTVTVVSANTAPTAVDDLSYNVQVSSTNNALDVLANDSDPDVSDTLTITAVGTPDAGGTVSINGTNDGLVYSPLAAYTGTESFTYTVSDGEASAQATVTVGVISGNTLPTVNDDTGFHVAMNSANNALDVLANDSDADVGDSLTITAVGTPDQGGTVVINGTSDGLLYTPAVGVSGPESFTYTVSDGTANIVGNVTVTIVAANTLPVATDDSVTVTAGSTNVALPVLANDTDADVGTTLTVTAVGTPDNGGTVTPNGANVLYTPAIASGTESFTYTVSDGIATAQATVTVNVIAAGTNTPPVANDDPDLHVGMGTLDNPLDVLANDTDADLPAQPLSITAVGATSNGGTVTINGTNDGLVYTPASGYSGTETFSYTMSDGTATANATVTVMIASANTPPIAVDDTGLNVAVDSSNNLLDVLANDSDNDIGDVLTITAVGTPTAGGAVTINGTNDALIYTPAAAYAGPETFTYTVTDGKTSTTAAVSLNVVSGNTAPFVLDDLAWNLVVTGAIAPTNNLADRAVGFAIRQASSATDALVTGTYNIVQHAGYLTEVGGTDVLIDTGYKYGSIDFDGLGNATSGSLFSKRVRLDLATALGGTASALSKLPTPVTPETSSGIYAVNNDGTVTMTLTIGTQTVTGTGAVSASGEVIALAVRIDEGGVDAGRGLLFLIRQP